MENKRSDFVTLTGINFADLKACAISEIKAKEIEKYDVTIPSVFTSAEEWPRSIDLKCWHCGLPCGLEKNPSPKEGAILSFGEGGVGLQFYEYRTGVVAFIPLNVKFTDDGETCNPYGVFNSWPCAAAFIFDNFVERERNILNQMLCIFEAKFTGHYRSFIPSAPPRLQMKKYCGRKGMTKEEYIAILHNLSSPEYNSSLINCSKSQLYKK